MTSEKYDSDSTEGDTFSSVDPDQSDASSSIPVISDLSAKIYDGNPAATIEDGENCRSPALEESVYGSPHPDLDFARIDQDDYEAGILGTTVSTAHDALLRDVEILTLLNRLGIASDQIDHVLSGAVSRGPAILAGQDVAGMSSTRRAQRAAVAA